MTSEKPNNVRELIEQGYAFPALLPEMNDFLLNDSGIDYRKSGKTAESVSESERSSLVDLVRLESLSGYTIPLIDKDYGAKTAVMWNTLYEKLDLPIRNIMLVANPENAELILDTFKRDPKYLGGGLGSGFKEKGKYLDKVIPEDLRSVNIAVKENGRLVGYNTDASGLARSAEDKLNDIVTEDGVKSISGSNVLIFGAGGVAKEFARELGRRGARRIGFVNRTVPKATALAHSISQEFPEIETYSVPETLARGASLNTLDTPNLFVNTTNKGNDGPLVEMSAFAPGVEQNKSLAIDVMRDMSKWNPHAVIVDIVLPKGRKSTTLAVAESAGLKNLVDGIPMVINQAAPAYVYVQNANPEIHTEKVSEEEALKVFKEAVA